MPYKAVLFDLDGTLLDTLDDIGASLNHSYQKNGLAPIPRETFRKYVGEGITKLITHTLPKKDQDQETIDACIASFIEHYTENWNVKTAPYEGIPEMLDRITHRGMKMAVLSNKTHPLTTKCVSEFLGQWNFDPVLGLREGFPRKPDPTSALEVAQQLAISPEEIVYVGDTGIDMKTAVAASMFPVGVLWGFRGREELEQNGARAVISRPMEFLDIAIA